MSRTMLSTNKSSSALVVIAFLAFPMLSLAQDGADLPREITWAGEVAAIFQEKCQECHRPNSIGPMSLLTYDEAKVFAPVIRYRVENRVMPPWHINPNVGIQEFINDRGLSEVERQTNGCTTGPDCRVRALRSGGRHAR